MNRYLQFWNVSKFRSLIDFQLSEAEILAQSKKTVSDFYLI